MLTNRVITSHWLTTTRVLPENKEEFSLRLDPVKLRDQIMSKKSFVNIMHVGTEKTIAHSTIMVIGRTSADANLFALFLDARGTAPDAIRLGVCDYKEEMRGFAEKENQTVQDLYGALMTGLDEEVPPLMYSSTDVQADLCSCTAYSALFADALLEEFSDKENFDPQKFMENMANGKYASFFKARGYVHRLFPQTT